MTTNTAPKVKAIVRRFNKDSEAGLAQATIDAAELEATVASIRHVRADRLGSHIRMSARLIIRVLTHALDEVGMLSADVGFAIDATDQAQSVSLAAAREGTPVAETLGEIDKIMRSAVVGLEHSPATTVADAETIVAEWLDGIDPSHSASPTRSLAVGAARALQATLVILDGGDDSGVA